MLHITTIDTLITYVFLQDNFMHPEGKFNAWRYLMCLSYQAYIILLIPLTVTLLESIFLS